MNPVSPRADARCRIPTCLTGSWVTALLLATMLCCGCDESSTAPPITAAARDSLLGRGKVLIITNNSNHHLYDVKVVMRSGESSASVRAAEHLAPLKSVEIGWRELENWKIEPGQRFEIHADDYNLPAVFEVPP